MTEISTPDTEPVCRECGGPLTNDRYGVYDMCDDCAEETDEFND